MRSRGLRHLKFRAVSQLPQPLDRASKPNGWFGARISRMHTRRLAARAARAGQRAKILGIVSEAPDPRGLRDRPRDGGGLSPGHPLRSLTDVSPLILAARGLPTDRIPVWFMRQAGRSLPEYRQARAGKGMLETCFDTDLVVEITLQPVRRHGVDAAILFSDIVVPLRAAGVDIEIRPGVGPVLADPFREQKDVRRLADLDESAVSRVTRAVATLAVELGHVPLIGFCGAPFTLASYLIEGGPSRDHARTKALMWSRPDIWEELMSRLADVCSAFLRAQVLAGASAVQVFDSWAGALSRRDYVSFVLPHTRKILDSVSDLDVPRIHFGVGTGELLSAMAVPECEVVGVDHRVSLADAITRIGAGHGVQGNIDPAVFFAGREVTEAAAAHVIAEGAAARGHILNLGHGVLPDTDPRTLTDLVAWVHEHGESARRDRSGAIPADTELPVVRGEATSGNVGS